MAFVKKVNAVQTTSIMVQPENEIGMLPPVRDYHSLSGKKNQENLKMQSVAFLTGKLIFGKG